jgi:hypothetical protein
MATAQTEAAGQASNVAMTFIDKPTSGSSGHAPAPVVTHVPAHPIPYHPWVAAIDFLHSHR